MGVTPAKSIQPFLPVQLAWADMVTGSVLKPEMEVIVPSIQPDVFRYCNLCHVDRQTPALLEFNAKPEPNRMQGQWPTKKPPGHYKVDVVLTAENFDRRFVTFEIDFNGGPWPADDNFDGMFTVDLIHQGREQPTHPVSTTQPRLGASVWFWVGGVASAVLIASASIIAWLGLAKVWFLLVLLGLSLVVTWAILLVISVAANLVTGALDRSRN